ncbi:flagellar basal body-associated FliL family protein [Myxococcota bacterium]|nr:flagellar basal body-associated FliL family protein [Myxococcota bacterium]MBU1897080.1 flagellar basal body-associated FliL family protein [Myxococcota bacterium]
MAEEQALSPGGGGGKLGMIIGLLNLIGLIGLAVYIFVLAPKQPTQAQLEQKVMKEEITEAPPDKINAQKPGPMMELGVLVVNLREPTGDRYLKTKLIAELDAEETRAEIESRLGRAKFELTKLLSGQRVADVQGPESMEALRRAMTRRLNAIISKGRVVDVWPEEWIVQ